jgi:hypothetical protein
MPKARSPQGRKNLHATNHRPPNTTDPHFRSMQLNLQFFPKFSAHLAIELLLYRRGTHALGGFSGKESPLLHA